MKQQLQQRPRKILKRRTEVVRPDVRRDLFGTKQQQQQQPSIRSTFWKLYACLCTYIGRFFYKKPEKLRTSADELVTKLMSRLNGLMYNKQQREEVAKTVQEVIYEDKNCPICMDDTVARQVFLPCRHLYACKECGNKLENCPICRTDIASRVNIFH